MKDTVNARIITHRNIFSVVFIQLSNKLILLKVIHTVHDTNAITKISTNPGVDFTKSLHSSYLELGRVTWD